MHTIRWRDGSRELPVGKILCVGQNYVAHIVELMVRSALIRASIAMQAKLEAEKRLPIGVWMNPLQWLTVWRQILPELVLRILHGRPHGGSIRWRLLARLAADPNRSRPPTRWRCMASTRMAATSSA